MEIGLATAQRPLMSERDSSHTGHKDPSEGWKPATQCMKVQSSTPEPTRWFSSLLLQSDTLKQEGCFHIYRTCWGRKVCLLLVKLSWSRMSRRNIFCWRVKLLSFCAKLNQNEHEFPSVCLIVAVMMRQSHDSFEFNPKRRHLKGKLVKLFRSHITI